MKQPELFKYNPTLSKPEEIKKTFVAREALLEEILKDLQKRSKILNSLPISSEVSQ